MTNIEKRNEAVSRAYGYARAGALATARILIRRAASFAPLTDMQLYRLRRYFGAETVEELTGVNRHGAEILIRGLERRLHGK